MNSETVQQLILAQLKARKVKFRPVAIKEMQDDFGLTPLGMIQECIEYLEMGGEIEMFDAKQIAWAGRTQYLLRPTNIEGSIDPYVKFMWDKSGNLHLWGVSAHDEREH